VRGDPDLLAQAIGNLVDNAIKYTPCGGTVALHIASDTKDQVAIAVTDTGPGIADADKPRATERFYRGNRASGTEGVGLGLSVVDAVARLHGGVLSLTDNRPGLGAILTLPRNGD
jgi:signal transduction histidine kinase